MHAGGLLLQMMMGCLKWSLSNATTMIMPHKKADSALESWSSVSQPVPSSSGIQAGTTPNYLSTSAAWLDSKLMSGSV